MLFRSSFSLSASGNLDNATLTLADGTSLPVVGQATRRVLKHGLSVNEVLERLRAALLAPNVPKLLRLESTIQPDSQLLVLTPNTFAQAPRRG